MQILFDLVKVFLCFFEVEFQPFGWVSQLYRSPINISSKYHQIKITTHKTKINFYHHPSNHTQKKSNSNLNFQMMANDCMSSSSGELCINRFYAFELFFLVVLQIISLIPKCWEVGAVISGSTDLVSIRLPVISLQSTYRTLTSYFLNRRECKFDRWLWPLITGRY